jgi:hypothetical protein
VTHLGVDVVLPTYDIYNEESVTAYNEAVKRRLELGDPGKYQTLKFIPSRSLSIKPPTNDEMRDGFNMMTPNWKKAFIQQILKNQKADDSGSEHSSIQEFSSSEVEDKDRIEDDLKGLDGEEEKKKKKQVSDEERKKKWTAKKRKSKAKANAKRSRSEGTEDASSDSDVVKSSAFQLNLSSKDEVDFDL